MKKGRIVWIVLGGLVLLAALVYLLLPSLVIVPPAKIAVIVPAVNATPGIPEIVFIGVTTSPIDLSTNQGVINNIILTFSEAMDPATVNQNTFIVKGPNNAIITGAITSDMTKKIWTFKPTINLGYDTIYNVTVTTGAKGVSGNALIKNFLWSFTTSFNLGGSGNGGGSGSSTPTVIPGASPILTTITLSPLSASLSTGATRQLTPTSLDQFGSPIVTTINYTSSNLSVATVNASGFVTALALGNSTITATNGVIGGASIIYVTGIACPAVAVNLGTAVSFAVLSKAQISDLVTPSFIIGDVGASPITGSSIHLSCTEVTGKIYGVDAAYTGGSDSNVSCYAGLGANKTLVDNAISDMASAYTVSNGLASCDTELGAGNLGGLTIPAGVHKFSSNVIIPTAVTLSGNATDVWVFQIAGNLDISSATHVNLIGGALAKNVYWIVAGQTTLGTTSVFQGTILSGGVSTIALNTGATLNGRAMSQFEVTLLANNVTKPN